MAAILPEGSTPLPTGIVAALFVSMVKIEYYIVDF